MITCQKILSLTGIKQAKYVINPYRGCQFGCAYCYAQWNKFALKQNKTWGDYVQVKSNAVSLLRNEMETAFDGTIMLGSTTEVYQPAETKYRITRGILEILSDMDVPVIILTKSDLILRDLDLLKKFSDILICFTINTLDNNTIRAFEKSSPPVEHRLNAIGKLRENGVPVYLHVGPYLPELTHHELIIEKVNGLVDRIDFENLNLKMVSLDTLRGIIRSNFPELTGIYENIYQDNRYYDDYWNKIKHDISLLRSRLNIEMNVYFHPFDSFFKIFR